MQSQSPLGSAFMVGSALFLVIALAGLAQAGELPNTCCSESPACAAAPR